MSCQLYPHSPSKSVLAPSPPIPQDYNKQISSVDHQIYQLSKEHFKEYEGSPRSDKNNVVSFEINCPTIQPSPSYTQANLMLEDALSCANHTQNTINKLKWLLIDMENKNNQLKGKITHLSQKNNDYQSLIEKLTEENKKLKAQLNSSWVSNPLDTFEGQHPPPSKKRKLNITISQSIPL